MDLSHLLRRSGELSWLGTDAGHLILMPASARSQWSGTEPSRDPEASTAQFRWNQPDDPPSDYDRACDVNDYVGILNVGAHQAIVLGQDPLPTAGQPLATGGLLIARLYTTEIGLPATLPSIADLEWQPVGHVILDGSRVVLFDSTEPGWEDPVFPSVEFGLAAGRYNVEHTRYRDADVELWLVRLNPG